MSDKPNAIVKIQNEIELTLQDKATVQALLTTTFKGLSLESMRQAMLEGMLRNFTLKDFLEKNVYAIPFKDGYSLVTSIDNARKIGMRAGIVGKDAPQYETDPDGAVIACSVTVKRKLPKEETIGDFTATVYFAEYYKAGRNGYPSLWDSKPRTMLAKVAEMHALRMACPEELAESYVAEEFDKPDRVERPAMDLDAHKAKLEGAQTLEELADVWAALPGEAKTQLEAVKDEMKKKFSAK
jgi:RecT family